jgi:prophage tail gpP-like protein
VKSDDLILSIGGRKYGGWEEISIDRSIDNLCSTFRVVAAAKEDGSGPDFQFRAGAAVAASIDGENLITGWADRVSPRYDKDEHSIDIEGRDRACDLTDCSAEHATGSWKNARIEDIAAELAKPMGITITVMADTGERLKRFSLQQGETVYAAIERLLRFRGLLAVSAPDGSVQIIAAKQSGIDFRLNSDRILDATSEFDVSERYSKIIVKGQASGDDEANGKTVSKVRAEAVDLTVERPRTLIIIAEEQATIAALETRAKWEVTTRAAKAQSATITMAGWRDDAGALYAPNRIVYIKDRRMFIDSPMLVTAVSLTKDLGGSKAVLTCAPPEAWSQLPIPEEREAARLKNGSKAKGRGK